MQPFNYRETKVITATESKKNLRRYLDDFEHQNELDVTKNGNKIARITPYVIDIEHFLQ